MSQITKRALEQSLKNLLLQKPLTKITINDIAGDCGINRMTFYYHFKDIYDLVEWSCMEDARAGYLLHGAVAVVGIFISIRVAAQRIPVGVIFGGFVFDIIAVRALLVLFGYLPAALFVEPDAEIICGDHLARLIVRIRLCVRNAFALQGAVGIHCLSAAPGK